MASDRAGRTRGLAGVRRGRAVPPAAAGPGTRRHPAGGSGYGADHCPQSATLPGGSCIPIVDHEMKPLGIITIRSILKALGEKKVTLYN